MSLSIFELISNYGPTALNPCKTTKRPKLKVCQKDILYIPNIAILYPKSRFNKKMYLDAKVLVKLIY
jgi:hypothetical protein